GPRPPVGRPSGRPERYAHRTTASPRAKRVPYRTDRSWCPRRRLATAPVRVAHPPADGPPWRSPPGKATARLQWRRRDASASFDGILRESAPPCRDEPSVAPLVHVADDY